MSSESNAPFDALIEYLDAKNYNYDSYPEENRVSLTMSGYQANNRFTFRITHEGEFLQVTAQYPFFVRNEKLRPSAAELLTRANYNLLLGNFEMDMKDGEVRFHVTHMIVDGVLAHVAIDRAYRAILFTMDRYFPALMQHIHAGYTPEDAIFHAELDTHAERVEETPKPADTPTGHPSATETTKPRTKRASRRKHSGGDGASEGELPR